METNINKVKYMFEFLTTLNRLVNNLKREDYLLSGGNVVADDMIVSYTQDDDLLESITYFNAKTKKDARKYGNQKIDNFMAIVEDINSMNIIINVEQMETIYKLKKYLVGYDISDKSITFHLVTDDIKSTMVFGRENDMSITMNGSFNKESAVAKMLDQDDLDKINEMNVHPITLKDGDVKLTTIYPYSELIVKDKLHKHHNIALMVLAGYDNWSFELVSSQNIMKPITVFQVESIFSCVRFEG